MQTSENNNGGWFNTMDNCSLSNLNELTTLKVTLEFHVNLVEQFISGKVSLTFRGKKNP
jgi:hypothetical protein